MFKQGVRLVLTLALVCQTAEAQRTAAYEEKSVVTSSRIELKLPAPYLLLRWPEPPVRGFYAWKITFGNDPGQTIVFRTDSAIVARNPRDVMNASALYRCPERDASVLRCVDRIQGTARLGRNELVVEITERSVVASLRDQRPAVFLRQTFEPDGRFRVDHVGATYK